MAGNKASKIDIYGTTPYTRSMFANEDTFTKWFPRVYRDVDSFKTVVMGISDKGGLDFEFPPSYKASIIGVSNYSECAAVTATPELVAWTVNEFRRKKAKIVGHSVIGAEKEVIKVTTGIETSIDEYDDSMLKHYLLNADLSKAPDKGEEDDAGALGFMGLWTAVSLELDVPAWKSCRGTDCEQTICPKHDSKGYCAVDAWSSLALDKIQDQRFKEWNIPDKLYNELKELTYIAQQMQSNGVKVNMPFVNSLEEKADEYKERLFKDKGLFNPRASTQVTEWFGERGVKLESNTKKDIQKALEKQAEKYGFTIHDKDGKLTLDDLATADDLPPVLDALYRQFEYKATGKGLDPWFAAKYRDANDFIHPRFITIGASTSRWSSSRPNFTNIPARGFGALVRAAIVPRDESLDIVHSDASNLELRVCTYLGGVDPSILGPDPFKWLVDKSEGAFKKAADLVHSEARQVAKSVAHASNYLEGIKILTGKDLATSHIKKEIEYGCLYVYKDWEYGGGVVAFTGANLAERLFGDKTRENRKKALQISEEIYFKQLPFLRTWHKKVLQEIEEKHYVRYPTGHFLRLYGSASENAKVGMAAYGQGFGAAHIQGILLRFVRESSNIPILFVHDSLDFEVPRSWSDKQAKEFISLMGEETDRLPGFKTPYKAFRGRNGLEYSEKNPETWIEGALRPL